MAPNDGIRLSEIPAELCDHSANLDHALDHNDGRWFCRTCSERKVALCEYMLGVNARDEEHPFIPPTAIDWLGNGMVTALAEMEANR